MSGLSGDEWQIVFLTLGVAARSVAFGLAVAVLVAWLLVRGRFFGRPILDAVAHLPMVLPPVVIGWLLLLIFGVEGPIGAVVAVVVRSPAGIYYGGRCPCLCCDGLPTHGACNSAF